MSKPKWYQFKDDIPRHTEFLLVDIGARDNCDEDDGAYLELGCIMEPLEYKTFKEYIQEHMPEIDEDYSSGGHSCVIHVDSEDIISGMISTPITREEADTLVKFGYAAWRTECSWYRELMYKESSVTLTSDTTQEQVYEIMDKLDVDSANPTITSTINGVHHCGKEVFTITIKNHYHYYCSGSANLEHEDQDVELSVDRCECSSISDLVEKIIALRTCEEEEEEEEEEHYLNLAINSIIDQLQTYADTV